MVRKFQNCMQAKPVERVKEKTRIMEDARKINRRYDELMDTQNEIFQAGQPGSMQDFFYKPLCTMVILKPFAIKCKLQLIIFYQKLRRKSEKNVCCSMSIDSARTYLRKILWNL